jgi:translation initiation factor 3 subunit J
VFWAFTRLDPIRRVALRLLLVEQYSRARVSSCDAHNSPFCADDDEFEVPSVAETQKVAASWEDEEEEEETPVVAATPEPAAPKGPLKPKQLKKMKLKEIEEKQKLEIALTKARLAAQAEETEDQRRAREKASIEEADFEMAIDAFAGARPAPTAAAGDDADAAISGLRLLSLADHEHLGDVVSSRLASSNSKYALECLKVILTKASVNLTADDMKEITTIVNVIKNEKIAAAKPKGKKKKQTGKQGYANVERSVGNGGAGGKAYAGLEDTYDDYDDFM